MDENFTEGLKKLLGIDDDVVTALIEKASTENLNELAHAITTNNKRKALMIYYALKPRTLPESVNTLNVGDVVVYDGRRVRVQIPNGPSDTVGITIKVGDKVKMVRRQKIKLDRAKLDEESVSGVLGMTMLPGIARMQELAGLSNGEPSGVAVEVVDDPEYDDHMTCALNALEALEGALPEIPLKDLKIIRARISEITKLMYESAPAPQARKLKD
jgi:hypothetical protein